MYKRFGLNRQMGVVVVWADEGTAPSANSEYCGCCLDNAHVDQHQPIVDEDG